MQSDVYTSIVLFVYDDVQRLEKCLCHILDYTPAGEYELIVAECMECEYMHEYLIRLPNIQLISYRDVSVGTRYQEALSLATGLKIVFVHDYVWLGNAWLTNLYDFMDSHNGVAVVQPFCERRGENAWEETLYIYDSNFAGAEHP